jgi:glycosyltransferase involved in cell wall biosynthesis
LDRCVSLILPIHNEAYHLERNTRLLERYMDFLQLEYELLLVENGSKDGTGRIARGLAYNSQNIKLIELEEPNLGMALKSGAMKAVYDKLIYYPIDLSVSLSFIEKSIELLNDYDLIVGSKRMNVGLDHRDWRRIFLSICFHRLVRLLYKTKITDTTCVKAYRKENILKIMNRVPSGSQVFETELLLEAQRNGLRVIEVPVEVDDHRESRQPLVSKVHCKMRDLLSLRLDLIAFSIGGLCSVLGLISLIVLSFWKLFSGHTGFLNPYSYLLSMSLVGFGFQILIFGLMANLFLQLRKSVEYSLSQTNVDKCLSRDEAEGN